MFRKISSNTDLIVVFKSQPKSTIGNSSDEDGSVREMHCNISISQSFSFYAGFASITYLKLNLMFINTFIRIDRISRVHGTRY